MKLMTYLDKLRHTLEENNYPDFYDALEEVNGIIWEKRENNESDEDIIKYLEIQTRSRYLSDMFKDVRFKQRRSNDY